VSADGSFGSDPSYGWLPVLPVSAGRFRVADRELAAVIVDSGGALADGQVDVEIAAAVQQLRADARCVFVCLDASQPEGGGRLARAVRRSVRSLAVRVEAARARHAMRRLDYPIRATILWDDDCLLYPRGLRPRLRRGAVKELLPQRALVVGRRAPIGPSYLEAIAAEVRQLLVAPVAYDSPRARAGVVIASGEDHVVRIAVGPGGHRIKRQRAALDALAAARPRAVVADRVPWVLGAGKLGLANWSVEKKLEGDTLRANLPPRVLEDCLDFLCELHLCAAGRSPSSELADDAEIIAGLCATDRDRKTVRDVARSLDAVLVDVPRGFGHGDFWSENLLVNQGRLAGVVDWDAGAPGRLPMLDLLHLRLGAIRDRTRRHLGTAFLEHLLPWAQAGGDDLARSYAARIDLDLDRQRLEGLVWAYWLDRVAGELRMCSDKHLSTLWTRHNIQPVVQALRAESWRRG
jgi:aminoglycoside phosphotransferase (APT) family kinase protein